MDNTQAGDGFIEFDVKGDGFIRLDDVEPTTKVGTWTLRHPEAERRLRERAPEGAEWTDLGQLGCWWEAR